MDCFLSEVAGSILRIDFCYLPELALELVLSRQKFDSRGSTIVSFRPDLRHMHLFVDTSLCTFFSYASVESILDPIVRSTNNTPPRSSSRRSRPLDCAVTMTSASFRRRSRRRRFSSQPLSREFLRPALPILLSTPTL